MFLLRQVSTSRPLLSSVFILTGLLASHQALAQAVVGPADVSRVQERANQPVITQSPSELIEVHGPSVAAAPAGSEKIMLTLDSVAYDGLTVYKDADLASIYAGKMGQRVSVADIYQIAADITRKYRNDGYILTQVVVPPQTIEGGQIKLQVVEGFIGNVTVDGPMSDSERKLITAYAEQTKGEPLNTRYLEQSILLINDLPGVSARTIISPSVSQPGAADLRVVVQPRKTFEGQASLDNNGSRYLGPLEGQLALSANSLLGLNERITTDIIYAPGGGISKELAYGDIVYHQPVGRFGTSVDLTASLASTDPGYTLSQFDVNGHATTYSVKVNQPIFRTRAFNWSTYGLFDARNNSTQSNIDVTRKDYTRAVRFGTNVDYIDGLLGGGYSSLTAEVAKGLDAFGASDSGDANLSRPAGDPQFVKFTGELQRLQRVTGNVNFLVGVRGQLANDAMLSSEEFGVGGANYGRGYDPSEIVGDDGVAGKLELQVNDPFAFDMVKTYQLYGFVDAGRVWNDDATTAADKVISVVSTGVGVRTTLHTNTQAGLYVALPLTRDVQTLGNEDPRVFFNLSQKF